MPSRLPPEVLDFERVVEQAIDAAGGFDVVRAAERDPARREALGDLLGDLGLWDLELNDSDGLAAAAVACRAAGRRALPYPVAARLAALPLPGPGAVAIVDGPRTRVEHADLPLNWIVLDGAGTSSTSVDVQPPLSTKLGTFVCDVTVDAWSTDAPEPQLVLTLQAWTLLGMLEEAAQQTYAHVSSRRQFGAQLSTFQAVRFALSDVEVEVQGLTEMAKYTLDAVAAGRTDAPTDVMALRLVAQESAELVFRVAHQLHGAMGFCDETNLSWLSRYSQPLRRLPWSRARTSELVLTGIGASGLAGPFMIPSVPS